MQTFNWIDFRLDKKLMDTRLRATVTTPGWCRTITHILELGVPFEKLEVAEVGCGSGTYALAWAFLGAKTTLIDADDEALTIARNAFRLYEVEAEFVKADVLNIPPKELVGRFHLVASGGLAEHFAGGNRRNCFAFHRALLTKTGIARIGVPNRFSPFYRMVRGFRELTGTWDLDIEIAYDPDELIRIAEESGFRRCEVCGNNFMRKDIWDYSLGMASAFFDAFPALGQPLRKLKGLRRTTMAPQENSASMLSYEPQPIETTIASSIDLARQSVGIPWKARIKDKFSAGLILHGFT